MAQLVAPIGADLCCFRIQYFGVYSDCAADQYCARFRHYRSACRYVDIGVCMGGNAAVAAADDCRIENKSPKIDALGGISICCVSTLLCAINRLLFADGITNWSGLYTRYILVNRVTFGGKHRTKSKTAIGSEHDHYRHIGSDDIRYADRTGDWAVCGVENDFYEHWHILVCGVAVLDFYLAAGAIAWWILGKTASYIATFSVACGHICADNAVCNSVLYRLQLYRTILIASGQPFERRGDNGVNAIWLRRNCGELVVLEVLFAQAPPIYDNRAGSIVCMPSTAGTCCAFWGGSDWGIGCMGCDMHCL